MDSLSIQEVYDRVRSHIGLVAVITLVFILVAVGITLVLPKQYRAESQIFLFQSTTEVDVDPYQVQRGLETRVSTLIDLAYTDTFFGRFAAQDTAIRDTFPANDSEDRRRKYRRDVVLSAEGSGFISIDTYHESSDTALSMNAAIVTVLTEQAREFFGENIDIDTVDNPDLYDGIGRPNIILNLFAGAILGFFVGIGYALTRPVEYEEEELPVVPNTFADLDL